MARDDSAGIAPERDRSLVETLRAECRRLEQQVDAQSIEINLLRGRFARYESAIRGSHVIVYTQDADLRYTAISHGLLGLSVDDILGRNDEELWPSNVDSAIKALKLAVLATGEPSNAEIAFDDGPDQRWYDVHIEPLREDGGGIVGLTCAAVDVTGRKEGEAHLRLLLRELTHRSKNLLAVIQAMARQTARHAGSTQSFLTQFGARLQAMAASHDLLVREDWHGASLTELIRSQQAIYLDRDDAQVSMNGPDVVFKPEAAQNLGLALHELSVNAARFGALTVPDGRIAISWTRHGEDAGHGLEIDWQERFGPKVKPRRKQGFGSIVIEKNLARALGARVDLKFEADGLRCRIVIPADQFLVGR